MHKVCSLCTVRRVSPTVEREQAEKRSYLRPADRRRQLLDAAARVFDRVGLTGITMVAVAAEAFRQW